MHMIKLNLGSNKWRFDGWINIDADPVVEPNIVEDCVNLPNFSANVADEIYAGHFLEHLTNDEGKIALKKWKEILKPGGLLHVVVPDIRKGLFLYEKDLCDFGLVEAIALGNYEEREMQAHKQLFTKEKLLIELTCAGYSNIFPINFDDPELPIVAKVAWQTGFTCQRPTR